MKHYIIVKFNNQFDGLDNHLSHIKSIFEPLKEINGIHEIEYIKNVVNKENRFDLMIRITMDKDVLETYAKSPPHLRWKEEYSKFIESKTIFDSDEI